jgi:hypothetical protein
MFSSPEAWTQENFRKIFQIVIKNVFLSSFDIFHFWVIRQLGLDPNLEYVNSENLGLKNV